MTDLNPVELDYDKFFMHLGHYIDIGEGATEGNLEHARNDLVDFVTKYGDHSFQEGRRAVLREGPVRSALLEAQAKWLDSADSATGPEGKTVAKIIAMVFGELADEYRSVPKPQLDDSAPRLHVLEEQDPAMRELLVEASGLPKQWVPNHDAMDETREAY